MRIKFTKCIYDNYEFDIPYSDYVELYSESKYDAVFDCMSEANLISENVEIEDIDLVSLDDEDEEYLEKIDSQDREDIKLLNAEYLEGLL